MADLVDHLAQLLRRSGQLLGECLVHVFLAERSARRRRNRRSGRRRVQELEQDDVVALRVADEPDVAIHLLDCVEIVFSEGAGDAVHRRRAPVYRVGDLLAELVEHQPPEVRTMIHEPVQVEQSLIDDVLVGVAFVLEHDRRVVLVNTEAVDPTGLVLVFPRMVDDVLRLQEPDAEEGLHVRLDELLHAFLELCRLELDGAHRRLDVEQLDVSHWIPLRMASDGSI